MVTTMNQNEIVSSNNKYNENKISSYFYNKTVHEKSKEKLITYISINQVKKCQCYFAIIMSKWQLYQIPS